MRRGARSNKALQLTANSAFQLWFGSLLASTLGAWAASEALLTAAQLLTVSQHAREEEIFVRSLVLRRGARSKRSAFNFLSFRKATLSKVSLRPCRRRPRLLRDPFLGSRPSSPCKNLPAPLVVHGAPPELGAEGLASRAGSSFGRSFSARDAKPASG